MSKKDIPPQFPSSHKKSQVNLLDRREIEARILAPFIDALGAAFGREDVIHILQKTVSEIARQQGEQLAQTLGSHSLHDLKKLVEDWSEGNALEIEVLEQSDEVFSFNVTRCGYAEFYHHLGLSELGVILSCNRDYALIEGFNPSMRLIRTQTIIGGAPHCDFRYTCEYQETK
ncbi:MAG: L-2-amino-thiazoline-4-carboxylic acid hydrolase [Chloroflexota bacterium]